MEPKVQNIHIQAAGPGVDNDSSFQRHYAPIYLYDGEKEEVQRIGQKHVCRFCGNTESKKFKNIAHTIPQCTGNKTLFSLDECDDCNSIFSRYETDFSAHGLTMRTLLGMKGKSGFPKIKTPKFSMERDEGGLRSHINTSKEIPHKDGRDPEVVFKVDFANNTQVVEIGLPGEPHRPLYVFKSLLKMAFSVMPTTENIDTDFEDLKVFLLNIDARLNDDGDTMFFNMFHNTLSMVPRKPLLILSKKRDPNQNMPTYCLVMLYGAFTYQVFLPFYEQDKWLRTNSENRLLILPEFLHYEGEEGHCNWINGNSVNLVRGKPLRFNSYGNINSHK